MIQPGSTVWFTADQHWGHANIIRYTRRPFLNVTDMDEQLIADWNATVAKDDVVYHLGDLTLGERRTAERYLWRLNGTIHMLVTEWHHDRNWIMNYSDDNFFHESPLMVLTLPQYSLDGRPMKMTLCHYPMEEWEAGHYGAWHLHAHSHGAKDSSRTRPMLDVGVDNAYRLLGTWRPFLLEEVADILKHRGGAG
jgi:calcineurin-like phosphoesterase family protein